MQKMYVMAGTNGAGKSTYARSFFPKNVTYLNPDLMVKTFLQNKKAKELDAWKHVVKKINEHINGQKTFGFETTLSDKTVTKKLHAAKKNGFEVNLIYISLDNKTAIHLLKNKIRFYAERLKLLIQLFLTIRLKTL